jgi:hypothetical protein
MIIVIFKKPEFDLVPLLKGKGQKQGKKSIQSSIYETFYAQLSCKG